MNHGSARRWSGPESWGKMRGGWWLPIGCVAYESRIYTTHAWNLPQVDRSKLQRNISIGGHLVTNDVDDWNFYYLSLCIDLTCKRGSVGQSKGLLILRSLVRFHLYPENSNCHGFDIHRSSIKVTKLLLKVIKAIVIIIPIFCALPLPLRDCLYREKDVGGVLYHGFVSHLVHPKTLILDRLEHPKKQSKISQRPCHERTALASLR